MKFIIQTIFTIPAIITIIFLIMFSSNIRVRVIEITKMREEEMIKAIYHYLPFAYLFSIIIYLIIYISIK